MPELERCNSRAVTVDLPSKRPDGTFVADEAAVRQALDEIGEPAVLVGNPYSGMVITGCLRAIAVSRIWSMCVRASRREPVSE